MRFRLALTGSRSQAQHGLGDSARSWPSVCAGAQQTSGVHEETSVARTESLLLSTGSLLLLTIVVKRSQRHVLAQQCMLTTAKNANFFLVRYVPRPVVSKLPGQTLTRCKLGGLVVTPNEPAPRYDFEMLHANDSSLFLHFQVRHEMGGTDTACPSQGDVLPALQ